MRLKKISSIILCFVFTFTLIISPVQAVTAAVQTPITRSQAEQRALNIINLNWTFTKSKNTNISSSYSWAVQLPSQLKNITTAQMTGIPYNWGGFDGLNSHSYNAPWTNFLNAVSYGAYTGNVNTDGGYGYISGTAGLDCSGFVQAVFNINDYKQSTTTLFNNYFYQISISDIKHMDILDKKGEHVVIFDKWGYRNGVYGAYTYESTPDQTYGGIQGTKQYFMSMSEINRGYIAGRYKNIVEFTSTTTTTSAVKVGTFAKIINVNEYANFRKYASTSSAIIGTIPKDTIVYLKAYSNGWYQISYNGQTGWVLGTLIGAIPSGKYVTIKDVYSLNIRTSPSSTATIVGVLEKGDYAEVLGYSSDGLWYKISINGITGWSSSKYLSYIY